VNKTVMMCHTKEVKIDKKASYNIWTNTKTPSRLKAGCSAYQCKL